MTDKEIQQLPETSNMDLWIAVQQKAGGVTSKLDSLALFNYLLSRFPGVGFISNDIKPSSPAITPASDSFALVGPGTYTNFIDATNTPITIGTNALGVLRFTAATGFWSKIDIPIVANLPLGRAMGTISGSGTINVDALGALTTTGQLFVSYGSNFAQVTTAKTNLLTTSGGPYGLTYIYFDKGDSKVKCYNYTAFGAINDNDFIWLGVFYNTDTDSLATLSNIITINGRLPNSNSGAIVFSGEPVFDSATGVLKLPGLLLYNITGGSVGINESLYVTAQRPTPFSFTLSPSGDALLFDRSLFDAGQFPFIIQNIGLGLPYKKEIYLIGVNFNNRFTSNLGVTNLRDSKRNLIQKSLSFVVGTTPTINIDSTAKTITTQNGPGGLWLVTANSYQPLNSAVTPRLDEDGPLCMVWVKKADFKIYYSGYSNIANYNLEDWYLLGSFWNYDINSFNGNVALTINGVGKSGQNNNPSGELLLPKKMFLVAGRKLPVYKESIQRNAAEQSAKIAYIIQGTDTNTAEFDYPYYDFFENQVRIDPATVKPVVSFAAITKNRSQYFKADVSVKVKVPDALSGSTIKGQQIGDSLTNRGVSKYIASYLGLYSITYNSFGTLNNQGKQGEGREGWTFSNFIGRDNFFDFSGIAIARMPVPGDGDMNKNPFLKLATASDKTDHPDWCFRNTGAQDELSYAADTDKTGNFYIFDYGYYMTSYGIPNDLQIITIALSTNDFTINTSDAIDRCKFGLTIMLTQIKKALPNVKIGVVPAPSQGMSPDGDNRFNLVANWINASQKLVSDINLTGVDIIGVWAHMSRYFNDPDSGTSLLKNDGNTTNVVNNGEWIHFNTNGYKEYAPVVGNWILNVV